MVVFGFKEETTLKICFYEGYIRNQKQLCRQLGISGAASREETERQILLAAYNRWGYDIVRHFTGAFAFALWDEEKEEMLCARDPFGIQTFYYHLARNGALVCSGNIGDIAGHKGFQKEIDRQALQYYLMFGYPVGEKTLYKGVFKLLPGRTLLYRRGQCRIERYFTPVFESDAGVSEQEWVERIRQTLQSILEEDKGNFDFSGARCFLSGGVDSSYLLAASEIKNAGNISFGGEAASEYALAQETADYLGVNLEKINLCAKDFFEAISTFLKNVELPLADPSAVAFAAGCQRTVGQTTCCLSGEGADEFFAGYHIYRRADALAEVPYCGCFGVLEETTACRLLKQNEGFPTKDLVKDIEEQRITDNLNRMLATDIAMWLEGDILLNVGRNTRACGIDLLLPFADKRLFELSAQIPSALKLKDGCGKYIFRKAAQAVLPEEVAWRAKAGFPVPLKKWMAREPFRSQIEKTLCSETAVQFFDTRLLQKFWHNYLAGNEPLYQIIYTAYLFLRWYEEIFNA
ncbi:MAG: asparagine synthetase B [Ruminococcaceae bacterium]|nr:asparagine synthetase B [Oscillospiraceae bacterium]